MKVYSCPIEDIKTTLQIVPRPNRVQRVGAAGWTARYYSASYANKSDHDRSEGDQATSVTSKSAESLIAYCRENSRICPMPQRWNTLWELLPDRKRVGGGWEPALPLILAAWDSTPHLMKMLRLAEHLEWAAEHGAVESVAAFLRGLPEDEWFHSGD